MAKQKLKITDLAFDYNFKVLAIVSQTRDYHLCWQINKELNIELRRQVDLQLIDSKKRQLSYFSFFSFNDAINMSQFYLVANKSGTDLYLPEVKMADFLLIINGQTAEMVKKIISSIKKMTQVIAVTELNTDKLKSKKNLIFE